MKRSCSSSGSSWLEKLGSRASVDATESANTHSIAAPDYPSLHCSGISFSLFSFLFSESFSGPHAHIPDIPDLVTPTRVFVRQGGQSLIHIVHYCCIRVFLPHQLPRLIDVVVLLSSPLLDYLFLLSPASVAAAASPYLLFFQFFLC